MTLLRILILFVGLVIAHLCVSLFLLADLGSDPIQRHDTRSEKLITSIIDKH